MNGKLFKLKQRRQRRRKLSAQQITNVLKYFIDNPFDTYSQCIKKLQLPVHEATIERLLVDNKFGNFVACNKNFISMQNQIQRLKFALKYRQWTDEWLQVHFMDGKTVQTYSNGKLMDKRRINERFEHDKMKIDEKQNSRNKVNLFRLVSYNGPNTIYSVSTIFNGREFKQLVRKKVINLIGQSTVLLDNGLKYLSKRGVTVLDFPAKSNDMNIIENVWGFLKKKKFKPKTSKFHYFKPTSAY